MQNFPQLATELDFALHHDVSKERLQIRDRYVFHVPICISNKEANVSVSVRSHAALFLVFRKSCLDVKSPRASTHSRYSNKVSLVQPCSELRF